MCFGLWLTVMLYGVCFVRVCFVYVYVMCLCILIEGYRVLLYGAFNVCVLLFVLCVCLNVCCVFCL